MQAITKSFKLGRTSKDSTTYVERFSDDLIENAIQSMQQLTLDDFLWHSQSVERHVKLVAEVVASVFGEEMDI